MRRKAPYLVSAIAISSLCVALRCAAALAQAQPGAISGQIRLPNETPAAGFRVSAIEVPPDGGFGDTLLAGVTQTDAKGNYRLANIPPGRYYVVAGLLDSPTYYPGVAGAGSAKVVTVTSGSTAANVDFVSIMPVIVTVSAVALSEELGPTPRFNVSFDPLRRPISVSNDGSFTTNLPAGEYHVRVGGFPEAYRVASMTYGGADVLNGPMRVTPADAFPLTITFGMAESSRWVKVSGSIIGFESLSADGSVLRDIRLETAQFLRPPKAVTNPDGSFEIPQTLPGEYMLRIGPFRTPLVVGKNDVEGVEIRIPPSREVVGRIVTSGRSIPLPQPHTFQLTGTGAIQGSYLINDIAPDGTFKVTVPESEYKVAVGFLPSYRIESIRMGSVMSNG